MTSKWPDKIELLFQASVDPLDTEIPGTTIRTLNSKLDWLHPGLSSECVLDWPPGIPFAPASWKAPR